MNSGKPFTPSKPFRAWEAVSTGLLSGIPLSIGKILRRWVYKTLFASMGSQVNIQLGVEFVCAGAIELGDYVKIDRSVALRNYGRNSQIRLKSRVCLDIGVIIKTHRQGEIEIGDRTYIGPYTCLSGQSIKIGNACLIASHCGIYANNHEFADLDRLIQDQGANYKGITIEDDCWLGTGVKVLDGVTIGRGSVIGAGAVVTKNIPPYSIAVGVPAQVVSQRTQFNQDLVNRMTSPV